MTIRADSHAHLSSLSGRGIDTDEVLADLERRGYALVLDVGVDADDLDSRTAVFGAVPWIRYSAGVWPGRDAFLDAEASVGSLRAAIGRAATRFPGAVVAVGECGLDRHWNAGTDQAERAAERLLFALQAELALELGLPLIVHSRDAADETAELLSDYRAGGLQGVIHCFSYGIEEARRFLDLGFRISFAGNLTYKNADALREAARFVPTDRILTETDSPYLAPRPHRGKPSDPRMAELTTDFLAELRGEDREAFASRCAGNALALFQGSSRPTVSSM